MSNQELSKQLIKRTVSNLGVLSGQGLCHEDNALKKKLRLEDESGSREEFTVFGAECVASDIPVLAASVNIGTKEYPDLVIAICQEDTYLAIRYTASKIDHGQMLIRHGEKWVDMEVLHQLNLTAAIELITQNGLPWTRVRDQDIPYSVIAAILSEED